MPSTAFPLPRRLCQFEALEPFETGLARAEVRIGEERGDCRRVSIAHQQTEKVRQGHQRHNALSAMSPTNNRNRDSWEYAMRTNALYHHRPRLEMIPRCCNPCLRESHLYTEACSASFSKSLSNLEFCITRGPWKRYDITNILHTCTELNNAFKPQAKPRMWNRSVASQVTIPPEIFWR